MPHFVRIVHEAAFRVQSSVTEIFSVFGFLGQAHGRHRARFAGIYGLMYQSMHTQLMLDVPHGIFRRAPPDEV